MRVLVLGGTLFLGRHVVSVALARGHGVTTFARVRPSADIPLWLPADVPGTIDDRAARVLGLRSRPFEETVRDVLLDVVTVRQVTSGPARSTAISREREQELLRLLRQESASD